jgi:hypothetical protein
MTKTILTIRNPEPDKWEVELDFPDLDAWGKVFNLGSPRDNCLAFHGKTKDEAVLKLLRGVANVRNVFDLATSEVLNVLIGE